MNILSVNNKREEKILRKRPADFDFKKFSKKEINELIKKMREMMVGANGIGLAANQIGLDFRVFVAQTPKAPTRINTDDTRIGADDIRVNPRSNPRKSASNNKFYAVFNPEIIKKSAGKTSFEEGCLSVPGGIFGDVLRSEKITLIGQDKNGKKIKIKAWGLLARVFQHEVDHLNGILFTDRAQEVYKIPKND